MLAILNSNPIVDLKGKPVHGRFHVFMKDTNQYAEVFVYDENDNLITGANPIYTDNYGFPDYKVILDDQIYSIVVERYKGNYSDPKQDDRSEVWEIVNNYYEGLIANQSLAEGVTVYGLSQLKNADITANTVDVVGYYTPDDCGRRTYVWDESCVLDDDGGYIIQSNKESVGRWILLNDLPWIPSEYYGVYPEHANNMNALVSAPTTIKTFTRTFNVPNAIKFASGTYKLVNDIVLINDRNMIVDNETEFIGSHTITCNGVTRFGERTNKSIGRLKLPETTPARLSWFPTYFSFFTCGSKNLHVDCVLNDTRLSENVTLSNCAITFDGFPCKLTSYEGSQLTLINCTIEGHETTKIGFSPNVKFQNMYYTDKYIADEITNGILGSGLKFSAADFNSKIKFVNACIDTGIRDINLEGYNAGMNVNIDEDITFKNGSISSLTCRKATLENFSVVNLYCAAADLTDSKVTGNMTNTGSLVVKSGSIKNLTSSATNINLSDVKIEKLDVTSTQTRLTLLNTTISNLNSFSGLHRIDAVNSIVIYANPMAFSAISADGSAFTGQNDAYMSVSSAYFKDCTIQGMVIQEHANTTWNDDTYKLEAYNTSFYGLVRTNVTYVHNCIFNAGLWPQSFNTNVGGGITSNIIRAFIDHCTFKGGNRGIYLMSKHTSDSAVRLIPLRVNNCSFNQVAVDDGYSQMNDGIFVQPYTLYSTVGAAIAEDYIDRDPKNHQYFWENNSGNCIQTSWYGEKEITKEDNVSILNNMRVLYFGNPMLDEDEVAPFYINFTKWHNGAYVTKQYLVNKSDSPNVYMRREIPYIVSDESMMHQDYMKYKVAIDSTWSNGDKIAVEYRPVKRNTNATY